jgi:hypothetical protein
MRVFLLHHTHESSDGSAEVKFIGVYSTELAARVAISRLSRQRGFAEHPSGFEISVYPLDATHWQEGFVSSGDYVF